MAARERATGAVASSAAPSVSPSAEGDTPVSFEEAYEAHAEFLWRTARAVGVSEAAVEDVLQDVFVVVHRKLPEFQGQRHLRTWLVRILMCVIQEHRRRFRRKEDLVRLPDEMPDAGRTGPHEALERKQAAELLSAILDAMSEEQRVVFVLAEVEQVPVVEIADALEASPNTIYSRLRLARSEYQRQLTRLRAKQAWRLG